MVQEQGGPDAYEFELLVPATVRVYESANFKVAANILNVVACL